MSSITPPSAITDWPMPTAVVAYEAAKLVIAWLKAWEWLVGTCVQGPALNLWAQAFPGQPAYWHHLGLQPTASCPSPGDGTLLYVPEPDRNHWGDSVRWDVF
jgi:hypothetical protein